MPLSSTEIESELSHAYLHAVAGRAGAICTHANRGNDNVGTDAIVRYVGNDLPHSYLTDHSIHVQLKATKKDWGNLPGYRTYVIQDIAKYNKLISVTSLTHTILVVLFLDSDDSQWLSLTEDELLLKKSAYWIYLGGAPASTNQTSQTVYIPESNLLTPLTLKQIFDLSISNALPIYSPPQP